jgi:hypothetical protein
LKSRSRCLLLVVVLSFLPAVSAVAQARPQETTKGAEQNGFTWTETYEGSGNSDGFITDLNSTVGYAFGRHFDMDMGVPYLFFQPSTSKTGATSASGMGNPCLGFTYSAKGSALEFSTSLNTAIPTASDGERTEHWPRDGGLEQPFCPRI